MSKKKITILDIANYCGVSKTTVSFILNNKADEKRISPLVQKKVLDYIKQTGYQPNQLATSFRTGITKTIGLIVENISDSFFGLVAGEIEKLANKKGYKIIFSSTFNDDNRAKEIIKMFKHQHVDGLIITPSENIEQEILELHNEKKPFILFDRYYKTLNTNVVVLNNKEATYEACVHLIENDFKNIAFITIISEQNQMQERLEGYSEAIKNHNLTPKHLKINFNAPFEENIRDIKEFLENYPDCDSIFFATNYLTLRGLAAIAQLGKKIPDDYGVIAFDDHEIFQLHLPSITAVQQPIHEMCEQLMANLIRQMTNSSQQKAIHHTVVPARLMVRDSTKKMK